MIHRSGDTSGGRRSDGRGWIVNVDLTVGAGDGTAVSAIAVGPDFLWITGRSLLVFGLDHILSNRLSDTEPRP